MTTLLKGAQIFASIAANLCQHAVGHCVSMSAWILPQLQDNSENEDGLVLTESEGSWFGKFDKSKEFDVGTGFWMLLDLGGQPALSRSPAQSGKNRNKRKVWTKSAPSPLGLKYENKLINLYFCSLHVCCWLFNWVTGGWLPM